MNSDYLKAQQILYTMNIQSLSPQKLNELAEALNFKKGQNNNELYQKIINFIITMYQAGYKAKQGQYIQEILPKSTSLEIKTFVKNMFAYFHGYKLESAKGAGMNRESSLMGNNFPMMPGMNYGNYSNLQELASVDPYFYQRMYMSQMMYPMNNYQSFYPSYMNNYLNSLGGMPFGYYQKQYEKLFNLKGNVDPNKIPNINNPSFNNPPPNNFQNNGFGMKSPFPSSQYQQGSQIITPKDNIQANSPTFIQPQLTQKMTKPATNQHYKSASDSQPIISQPSLKKNQSNKQMKSTIASANPKPITTINYSVSGVSTRRLANETIQSGQKEQRQRSRNKVQTRIQPTRDYVPPKKVQKASSQKNQKFEFRSQLLGCVCKGYAPINNETFECQNCRRLFHYTCLKIRKPVQPFPGDKRIKTFCAMCKLKSLDPLQEIEKVISESYIQNISDNKFVQTINLKEFFHTFSKKNHSYQIQLRCIRLNLNDNNEITWPDECTLKVNNEKIIEFPALQQNSSSKKRKDIALHIGKSVFQFFGQSELQKVKVTLQVKKLAKQEAAIKRINNNYIFVMGIYLIKKLTPEILFDKIIADPNCWESDNYITRLFQTDSNNQVEIEQINVSIYDPYTRDIIKTPARGNKCKHGQCFDLKVFLSFMSIPKNRLWRCPICTKDCLNIKIDSKQNKIFAQITNLSKLPTQISFNKKGEATFIVQEEEQSHQRFKSHKKKLNNEKHVITENDFIDDEAKARLKTLKQQRANANSNTDEENQKNISQENKQSKKGSKQNEEEQGNKPQKEVMEAQKNQENNDNNLKKSQQIGKEKVQAPKEIEEKKPIEVIIESQSNQPNIQVNNKE